MWREANHFRFDSAEKMKQRVINAVLAVTALLLANAVPAAEPDFDAVQHEAVAILRDLVRIDTTSPPGNETRAARHLEKLLAAEGIESEIYGADPTRGNLVARLRGDGSKAPLLVMGHTDVVGAQTAQWSVDPFAAEIEDGFLYGRGTVDDKDTVTAGLMTMLLLKQSKPLAKRKPPKKGQRRKHQQLNPTQLWKN